MTRIMRWKCTELAAMLVVAGGIVASSATGALQNTEPEQRVALDRWSEQVWKTADGGSETELLASLEKFANTDVEGQEWILQAIERLEANIAKREEQRQEQIAETGEELDGFMEKGDDPIALSEALRVANGLELLTPNRDAFFAQPRISELVERAERVARQAVADKNWLMASELFARLDLLYENQEKYKAEREQIDRRLIMIRMYNPEKFWKMRNARRVAGGDEGFAEYNPIGDSWEEKLASVRLQTVLQAISRTYNHVDGVPMKNVLLDGLEAVRTLVNTPELADTFAKLDDDAARGEFLAALDEIVTRIENKKGLVTRSDAYRAAEDLLRADAKTVQIPASVIAHEFGNGAMSALDPYSAIIWPDELARFERSTRGEFVGVGISIQLDEAMNIKVVTPLEGSPAQRAGVRAGDLIKGVDGKSTLGFTLDQAVDVITGPRGTDVKLTMDRPIEDGEYETLDFPLTRQVIDLPSVKGWEKVGAGDGDWNWFVDEKAGIGYIRLTGFSEKSTAEFDRAVRAMKKQGLNGLVLDLRFNPGGLLDQAVSIASRFIDSGMIVRTEDANGRTRDKQLARSVPGKVNLSDIPVIVLINEGSASASEIVSGAIQAHAEEGKIRALIVGYRSFGKGSVQNVFPIPGDNTTYMKLTTQYYKLRTNHMIHRRPGATEFGISPDLAIEMLPQQSMDALILRRDADVLPLDENGKIIADAERPDPDKLLNDGIDLQLEVAVVLLDSQIVDESVAEVTRGGS
jgi:carboxyl-terminal processing protease